MLGLPTAVRRYLCDTPRAPGAADQHCGSVGRDEVIVPGRAVEDSEYRFFWLRRVFSSLSLVKVVRVNCERALPTELPQQRDPAGSVACPPAN